MQTSGRPLSGVKILDFTRVLAGPYCTALLADMGADVIKVESLGGDEYRHVGPFFDGDSALFENANRGKRSIAMDLKDPAEIAALHTLVKNVDVVVENFRPGVMAKLGLDAPRLQALNGRLIYASISGFGHSGPNAMRPAYDIIVQAMSGMMALTGEPDGGPTMVGEAIGDVAAGLFGSWAIMVALFERERSGQGRVIDLSLFDSLLAMMPTAGARVLLAGGTPARTGNRHPLSAPFGVYPAADGHFAIAVLNDRLFETFCTVIGQPHLASDPLFASDSLRRENEPALAAAIAIWSKALNAAEAVDALSRAGIPASEISDARDAWMSEQAQSRGLFSAATGADGRTVNIPEQPVHFLGDTRGGRNRAPKLDQHGEEIRAMIRELSK